MRLKSLSLSVGWQMLASAGGENSLSDSVTLESSAGCVMSVASILRRGHQCGITRNVPVKRCHTLNISARNVCVGSEEGSSS
jgi:hypothetical protein